MTKNGLFVDEQHGFVPPRNCMTNLLTALEEWTRIIDEGGSLDLIYTNFAKAFDSVPHVRLLLKLNSLLAWIKAFLSNRKQRVVIEGESLSWTTVESGIPQGSDLGPTLFAVFINDMPSYISSCCKMFADNAKIYRQGCYNQWKCWKSWKKGLFSSFCWKTWKTISFLAHGMLENWIFLYFPVCLYLWNFHPIHVFLCISFHALRITFLC